MVEQGEGDVDPTGESAGLAALFEPRPRFRRRLRGYDRADVDDYVAWVESELLVRPVPGTSGIRCSRCNDAAVPAPPVPALAVADAEQRDAVLLVGAMRELLRLAEVRAAEVVAEAERDAEQVRATARAEAEARLGNVSDLRNAALERVRRQAEELLREAAAERARLQEEAAAAAAELADLRRRQDDARESLRLLTDSLGAALEGSPAVGPDRAASDAPRGGAVRLTGNVVLTEPREPVAG
ncbi:hypothetical protein [Geodermatophilus sp. CPCC 206100]|uniref:hypothetical protein n=1 Tax=Geodermatophilus sp. CPCC 206100 TaxID=3020054 RepID=UPI003B00AA41